MRLFAAALILAAGCSAAVAQSAGNPPEYEARVLPQLDQGDENALESTYGNAINDEGMVTGELSNTALGFFWSGDQGAQLLQELFPDEADEALGQGINQAGDMVGGFLPVDGFLGQSHAFHLGPDGEVNSLPRLDPEFSAAASDINDQGMIVGSAQRAEDGAKSAVYWIDGEIHEIPDLGGPANNAFAVNNEGMVVGTTNEDWGAPWIAFRWTQEDGLEPLEGLVEDVPAQAIDINDNGVIVGRGGVSPEQNRPVYWDEDGQMHELPCLFDSSQCIAVAINDSGEIVGHEANEDEPFPHNEARIWIDGEVFHLQDLVPELPDNLELYEATAINDFGQIVAYADVLDADSPERVAVLLTPEGLGEIPEAQAVPALDRYAVVLLLALMAATGVLASGRLRRRFR